jgi:hypothetical protein
MKFQLVRAATAALYRYITTGTFPSSNDEFSPLLPEGPPKDYFNKNNSLSFAVNPWNEYIVYSFGPDQGDNKGMLIYDITNGTVSDGDLIITIPRHREYPFPRDGVKAANADELLAQFPNGLPEDPCAWGGRAFNILESIYDEPVVIFSFGFYRDLQKLANEKWMKGRSQKQQKYIPAGTWKLKPMYDSTNGVFSDGDLYFKVPRK